jgi:hypothetical protein
MFTREQIIRLAESAPLELFDPTRGSGDSEISRKMRRADFLDWLQRSLSGWESDSNDPEIPDNRE